MRRLLLPIAIAALLAALWLGGRPGTPGPADRPAQPEQTGTPSTATAATSAASGSAAPAPVPAYASHAREAVDVLHAYLMALHGPDPTRADGYWAGGRPGEGEELLRQAIEPGSLRIDNGLPQALDQAQPPQAYEIPVRLRLGGPLGMYRLQGYYRLRTGGEHRWQITSAQLQAAD